MLIRTLQTGPLAIENWSLAPGEFWCVLGCNASGKSLLAAALSGKTLPGRIEIKNLPTRPAWVSFETLQAQYEAERANDDTDFLDRLDPGTTGRLLLLASGASDAEIQDYAQRFGIAHLLDRGCRLFSSGELRRIQILAHVLARPDLLILDEPFDALDASSRAECSDLFASLAASGMPILLLVNRLEDVATWTTHLALLHRGKRVASGPRSEILASDLCRQLLARSSSTPPLPEPPPGSPPPTDPLFSIVQGAVRYGDITQFQQLDWTLRPGEHTLVTGPNGCGKSTLLGLISGDHPQCYANDIHAFGYRRGSGESIWDIKRHLGLVSPSLHRDYRAGGNVASVVLSGLFDSIGLYQQPSAAQQRAALQWLALFGLDNHATQPFRSLSYGQQRLALIARALVKQPPLLILDEPTQGLDDPNRHLLLHCLAALAGHRQTTLLFVSHRADEHSPLFQRRLDFTPDPTGQARFRIALQ